MLAIVTIVNSGCEKKAPVAREKMIEVMMDIMLLESGSTVKYTYGAIPDKIWQRDYEFVAKKNNLTTDQVKSAMDYYTERPEVFSAIMEQVITRLQKEQVQRLKSTP